MSTRYAVTGYPKGWPNPLPALRPDDLIEVSTDGTLLVTICHPICSATHEDGREAQLWHTQEDGFVAIEVGRSPLVLTEDGAVSWALAHGIRLGADDPAPSILVILLPPKETGT